MGETGGMQRQKLKLAELTDRLAVLERIATYPAARVSRDIEQLQ